MHYGHLFPDFCGSFLAVFGCIVRSSTVSTRCMGPREEELSGTSSDRQIPIIEGKLYFYFYKNLIPEGRKKEKVFSIGDFSDDLILSDQFVD